MFVTTQHRAVRFDVTLLLRRNPPVESDPWDVCYRSDLLESCTTVVMMKERKYTEHAAESNPGHLLSTTHRHANHALRTFELPQPHFSDFSQLRLARAFPACCTLLSSCLGLRFGVTSDHC